MRLLFLLLVTCVLALGCRRDSCGCVPPPRPTNLLKATVVQTNNLDCSKTVVSFDPSDTAAVFQITGSQHTNLFVVKELMPQLNILNQKLLVKIDNLKAEEEFACLTQGPAYYHIKFLYVEPGQ